jgi:hypothetical protein
MPPELPASRRGEGVAPACASGSDAQPTPGDKEGDATSDLFLKLPDAFLATYII